MIIMDNLMDNSVYDDIARLAFEIIQKIRMLNNEKDIEDYNSLDIERKLQIIKNVIHVMTYPDITPEEEHKKWMNLKLKDGWKYGVITDRKNKIHNCLVPFEQLNFLQILKDCIFIDIVKSYVKYCTREK
jgi:hypothetical protein